MDHNFYALDPWKQSGHYCFASVSCIIHSESSSSEKVILYNFHRLDNIWIGENFYLKLHVDWLSCIGVPYVYMYKLLHWEVLIFLNFTRCAQGFTVDIKGTAVQDTTCKRSLSSSVPTTPATSSSTEAGKTLIWFY